MKFKLFRKKAKAAPPRQLKPVRVDTDGRTHYVFKYPTDMPISRAVAAEHALRMAEIGMNKARLQDIVAEMTRLMQQEGNAIKIAALLYEIEVGLTSVAEEETLLQVAAVLTLEEGEPTEYDPIWANGKIAKWRRSPADRDFFLQQAWVSTRQFKELSGIDILSYLKMTEPARKRLKQDVKAVAASLAKSTSRPSASQAATQFTPKRLADLR